MQVLQRREHGGAFVEELLEEALNRNALSPVDRRLVQELVYGVVRHQATLDWLIDRKATGRAQKPSLRILMRLGLYQLFWLDRIPDHAAVHETVRITKHLGFAAQAGFVNAVLRGYARERDATTALLDELKAQTPSLGYSHPAWLCDRWEQRWGRQPMLRLLEWNNTSPKNFARLNALKTDAARLATRWQNEGVSFAARSWDWTGDSVVCELEGHPALNRLPSFQEGWFYVQDPSTLLAVHELDPQPGEHVLDFCAAPGGKTTLVAQRMQNRGRITAQDIHPERLELIRENCARLGVTNVETALVSEGASASASAPFDRILVDAPCSNTGVMRRRVDLRWRLRLTEIERLSAAQLEMLQQAARALKPGGTLVYSTCSLEPEENHSVVETFLSRHPAFRLERERTLLPFVDGVDGACVARFKRVS